MEILDCPKYLAELDKNGVTAIVGNDELPPIKKDIDSMVIDGWSLRYNKIAVMHIDYDNKLYIEDYYVENYISYKEKL